MCQQALINFQDFLSQSQSVAVQYHSNQRHKVIANHGRSGYQNEPITTRRKYMWSILSAGNARVTGKLGLSWRAAQFFSQQQNAAIL